jgi:hypothetical protein
MLIIRERVKSPWCFSLLSHVWTWRSLYWGQSPGSATIEWDRKQSNEQTEVMIGKACSTQTENLLHIKQRAHERDHEKWLLLRTN